MCESIKFTYENDDGEEIEGVLPAKFEVCGRCRGNGTHCNPSIDGHGITSDEWNGPDWDDDSRETYLRGGYDVTCESCGGLRVETVIDDEAIERGSEEVKALYATYCEIQEERADYESMCRMERMMGA